MLYDLYLPLHKTTFQQRLVLCQRMLAMKLCDVDAAQALIIWSSVTLPLAVAAEQFRADTLNYGSNARRLQSALLLFLPTLSDLDT